MKITLAKQKKIPASYVRIRFEERHTPMILEKDGIQTLIMPRKKEGKMTARTFRTLLRNLIRTAKSLRIEKLALAIDDVTFKEMLGGHSRRWIIQTAVENMLIASYEFERYKKPKAKETRPHELLLIGSKEKEDGAAFNTAVTIATYVNHCRDLANTPGGDMTPELLAKEAIRLARGTKVAVRVLGLSEIKKEKMGALLGVSRGSSAEPKFIVMEYWGAGKPSSKKVGKKQGGSAMHKNNPVVFVGKGITFDTGGLNLKPSDAVLDMHLDMSGGAAVIATLVCAAKLGLKKNLVGLIPAAENMVSGESYRPGDILTTMAGKTVDVLNTDAEGRLVLADGLTYAKRYNPRLVVDIATLTGAAMVALGQHASAIMTKHEKLQSTLMRLGEESGDYVWPLPLWDEYKQHTKGVFGDIANIPASGARYGGAINGGMFLSHFAEDYTWAHIDMAPRMTSAPGDYLAKGATGEPVRLLLKIAEEY